MNVSKSLIESIAKTLPIGYYTKRRIPLTISEDDETSWYNPSEDKICISLAQIQTSMQTVTEDLTEDEIECLVRSNLYHEVSHAILTPTEMRVNDYMNIFEDERIERKCKDFYMNVDFERDKYLMNGFQSADDIPAPQDAMQAFYNICRFGVGKQSFIDEFEKIYDKYKDLTKIADWWKTSDYEYEVKNLFNEVKKDFKDNPQDYQQGGQGMSAKGTPTDLKADSKAQAELDEKGKRVREEEVQMAMEKVFHDVLNNTRDSAVYNMFDNVIGNFNKRNSGGSSVLGYSGRINPRLVGREDYRYFERKSAVKGTNVFGSCHLTFYLDCSGSFYSNENIVNTMLCELAEIERKYKYFTFDVIFCECGQEIATHKNRMIKADGGNRLTSDIFQQFREMQKPNTFNYNIVLFDGDCCPTERRNFSAFDKPNCTVITDKDNAKYCKDFKSTKPIITKNYADELLKNIEKALQKAFR